MNGKNALIAIFLFGALLVAALYLGLQPGSLAGLAVGAGFSTWNNRRHRKRSIAFWSIVWKIRQADAANRERMLAELEPEKLRERVATILRSDGTNVASGDVEQFPFPNGLRRHAVRVYWTAWCIGLFMLLVAAFAPAPVWLRYLPVVVSTGAAYLAWLASRRESSYETVIEITPFRVSELFPDGRTRTVLFNRYLELHHEPKRKRLRLRPNAEDAGIPLDYRRMGFDRMIALILEYGRFRRDDSALPPTV